MIRYLRNQTNSDCGLVAILNILKWLGRPVTYKKNIPLLKRESNYVYTDDFKGVKLHNVHHVLRKLGCGTITATLKPVVDLEHLKKHVVAGNAFILWHSMTSTDAHYTVVVPGKNGRFDWINMGPNKTVLSITPEKFEKRVMSTQAFHDQVMAIMVRKRNDVQSYRTRKQRRNLRGAQNTR